MTKSHGKIAAVLLLAASQTVASAASLRLDGVEAKNRQNRQYTCATGKVLHVTYWNAANGQSFALLPVDGRPMLFVSTLAASGVRYQAASYTWWTKGPRATLYDARAGQNAPPALSNCVTLSR